MPETPAEKLAEDVDAAIRDAYHAIRTALHRVEDLKMDVIREPQGRPFKPEHEEMYNMYIDLTKRFQEMREEVRDRSDRTQPRPPTPGPAPHTVSEALSPRNPSPPNYVPPSPEPKVVSQPTDEPRIVKLPFQRGKSRPYVLVPVSFVILSPRTARRRSSSTAAAKFSFQRSCTITQCQPRSA
jgi:hypothetical protein